MTKRICLIDGSGYIFRAYFASPKMTNPEGTPINAVYGFLNMFLSLTTNITCDACLVLFDAKRQNFRNEIFSEYKATRPELPEDLRPQFPLIHEAVEALNLQWLQMEGYEADDLIATYTDLALKQGYEVTVVTADKDLMQLIRSGVTYYDSMKNKYFTPEDVKLKFGVYPERVTDVQALAGDSTDNIPGVPGIGIKTAAELVNMFGSLEEVLAHAEEIKQNKRRELILNHKEDALISQKLVTLKPDVPVELPLEELTCRPPHQDILMEFINHHAFNSLKNKSLNWLKQKCGDLPISDTPKTEVKTDYKIIENIADLNRLQDLILAENKFSFKVYSAKETLLGIAIGLANGRAFYLPLGQEKSSDDLFTVPSATTGLSPHELQDFLATLFQNPSILKISQDIKESLRLLENYFSISLTASPYEDISIMAYDLAINPSLASLSSDILEKELKTSLPENKKINYSELSAADILPYFAEEADYIFRIQPILQKRLLTEKKLYIYEGIDNPLSQTLQKMENAGVMVDAPKLKSLDTRFDTEMNKLSQEIYQLAGEEFNLGSPKQVGEILYTKLGLKGKKHTSGSLNTSAEVLEQMAEEHELPKKILEWRQYQKLKSTYTTALLSLMDKENRVHTTYNQTGVNTGRLSSLNPNLQNIPIRTPIGREIRECFIAKPNHKLIAADYSQVELRLLASIANVKFLQDAFASDVDIHRKTASQVFNIPYEEVDSLHRRRAKAINFGIVYGISAFGLAKEIDSTPAEAKQYIDSYFANMPEVKTFMDETINFARQNGFVTTPLNRKISIFGIQDNNKRISSFAERAAINAPIQGGAADIIKLAMNKISAKLTELGLKTKMLLQVHDELVFEAPIEEVSKVSELIKYEMEHINNIHLQTPLIADVGIGDNWGEAH